MTAFEKYAAKQHLTHELTKSAQLAAVGKAIGGLKTPKFFGKLLGGQTLSKAYSRGLGAMRRNPGKTGLGLAGLGGLTFMAGRSSKN